MAKVNKIPDSVLKQIESTEVVSSECFAVYDEDRDGALSQDELSRFLEDILISETHPLSDDITERIFNLLDEDKDGKICQDDFRRCGYYWLKQTLKPVSALVIVDVQNDFVDGSLSLKNCPAGQDGSEVIPVINRLLDTVPFDLVVYTKDWHPNDHISFIENVKTRPITRSSKIQANDAKLYDTVEFDGPPRTVQKLWPKHCVSGTWGSELHPNLKVVENKAIVNKGCHSEVDSYSAFWDNNKLSQTELVVENKAIVNKGCHSEVDSYSAFWDNNKLSQTELVRILAKNHVTDVYVCGVAYDVCVAFTSFDSLEHGFRTVLIDDACRGVDNKAIEETKQKLQEEGGIVIHSSRVKAIVNGEDVPSPLGLQTAKNVALARELVNRGIVK